MLPWQYPLLAGIALLHDKSCLPALGLVEIFSEEPHDFETAKVLGWPSFHSSGGLCGF